MTDIQTSFHSHQDTIDTLQSQQVKYEEETRSLNSELENLKLKLESKESEIDHVTTEEDEILYEIQLKLLKDKLEKEQEKREALQSHLIQITSEHNHELKDLLTNREQLEIQLTDLHREHDSSLSTSQREIHLLTVANQELLEQQHRVQSGTIKTHKLVDREGELQRTINQLRMELNANTKSSLDHERDLMSCRTRMEERERELNELRCLLESKENELDKLKERERELANEFQSVTSDLSQTCSQLSSVQESLTCQVEERRKETESRTGSDQRALQARRQLEETVELLREREQQMILAHNEVLSKLTHSDCLHTSLKEQLVTQRETVDLLTRERDRAIESIETKEVLMNGSEVSNYMYMTTLL